MDAQVVNKFLQATSTVLADYFSIAVSQNGSPNVVKGADVRDPVAIILGITGDLEGLFLIGYSQDTALNIARTMMGNPEYPQIDDMCRSALSELSNMIGGMTSTGLSELGYFCNLEPPAFLTAETGNSLNSQTMIALPFSTPVGDFRVCVGLREAG